MEGTVLHPWQDERGVYRFSRAEVERLARGKGGDRRMPAQPFREPRSNWLDFAARDAEVFEAHDGAREGASISVLEARIATLEGQLAARDRELTEVRISLESRCKELEEANAGMVAIIRGDLVNTVSQLPRRQVLRLLEEEPDLFDDLLP
jgi:hypothetical protein